MSRPVLSVLSIVLFVASAFGQAVTPTDPSAAVRAMLDDQPLPLSRGGLVLTLGQPPPAQLEWVEMHDSWGGHWRRLDDEHFTAWRKDDGPVLCVSMAPDLFANAGVSAQEPAGTSSAFGSFEPTRPIWSTQRPGLLVFSHDQRFYRFRSEPIVRLPISGTGVGIDLTPPSEQFAELLRRPDYRMSMEFVYAFLQNRRVPSVVALLAPFQPACRSKLPYTVIWGEHDRWDWAVRVQELVSQVSDTPFTLDDVLNDVFASVAGSDPWIAARVGLGRPTAASSSEEILAWLDTVRRWLDARRDELSRGVLAVLEKQSDAWLAAPVPLTPTTTRLEYGLDLASRLGAGNIRAGHLAEYLPVLEADPEQWGLLACVHESFRALQQRCLDRGGHPDSAIRRYLAQHRPAITDSQDAIFDWEWLVELNRAAQLGAAARVLRAWIEPQPEGWLESPTPGHDGKSRIRYYLELANELDSEYGGTTKWMERLRAVNSNAELAPLLGRLRGLISARMQGEATVAEAEGRRATAAALLCLAHRALGGEAALPQTALSTLASNPATLLGRAAKLGVPLALLAWPPLDPAHAESERLAELLEAREDLASMPLQTILGLFSGRSEELVAAHKRHDPGVTLLALSGDGPSLVPTRKAKEVRWRKFVDASGDDPDDPVAKQLQKIRILESRLESSRWLRNWNGTSGLEAESAALLSVRDDVGSAHRDMTEDLARGESKLRESELLLNSTDFSTTRGLEIRRGLEVARHEFELELKEVRDTSERSRHEWNNLDASIRDLQAEILQRRSSSAEDAEVAQLELELARARAALPDAQLAGDRMRRYERLKAHDDQRAETLLRYRKAKLQSLLAKLSADDAMSQREEELMWSRWWLGSKDEGLVVPPEIRDSRSTAPR